MCASVRPDEVEPSRKGGGILRPSGTTCSGLVGGIDAGLVGLGDGVDDTGDTSDANGRDVAKRGLVAKEEHARSGDGKLVEGADHGVGCRAADADAPRGRVRDQDGRGAREGDSGQQDGPVVSGAT